MFALDYGRLMDDPAVLCVLAANGIETPRLLLMSASGRYPNGLANASGQVGRNFMDHPGLYVQVDLPEPVYPGRGPVANRQCLTWCEGDFRQLHAGWQMGTDNTLDLHTIARLAWPTRHGRER